MSGDVSAAYNQRGIVPRAIHHLFHESELRGDKEIEVRVSHLEIYNDVMYDLLADDVTQADNLQIVDRIDDPRFPETFAAGTGSRETVIKGLTKKYCANEAEALAYFFAGEANRATAAHILNKSSSSRTASSPSTSSPEASGTRARRRRWPSSTWWTWRGANA